MIRSRMTRSIDPVRIGFVGPNSLIQPDLKNDGSGTSCIGLNQVFSPAATLNDFKRGRNCQRGSNWSVQ